MCKNHRVIKSQEESMDILVSAHEDHTYDCCPQVQYIDYVERNEAIKSLVGIHPVYGSPMVVCTNVKAQLIELTLQSIVESDTVMDDAVASGIRAVLRHFSAEEWSSNSIPNDTWNYLQSRLNEQKETFERGIYADHPKYKEFTLIKRSSPKISNLIASILKFYGKDPQNDPIMTKFNARQANKMPEFDLVISYEPHRVVGMSAFGKFTSCQDWIVKDQDHDYHSYTHMAWANMLDETCGVAYIRKSEDDEPSEQETNVQDMLARSLVRAITLSNGHVVVYLHRIYAASPYDQVMRETFNKWEKTLPENYHVIKMYDYQPSHYEVGKNPAGIEYRGMMTKTLGCSLYVDCGLNRDCRECEGSGRVTCPCCDGDGTIWIALSGYDRFDNYYEEEMELECRNCGGEGDIECEECDGSGTLESDEQKLPYNDHSDWITFGHDGAKFRIPKYIVNWEVAPVHTCAEPPPSVMPDTLPVGTRVRVKRDLEPSSSAYSVGVNREMAAMAGQIVTIRSVYENNYKLEESPWTWKIGMFEEVISLPTTLLQEVSA